MINKVVCVTNNPLWEIKASGFTFVNGVSWDVFIQARDLIHQGWQFICHPLYGNFNPCRHPYRTLLLSYPEEKGMSIDMDSFSMLEAAIESCRDEMRQIPERKDMPDWMKDDYAMLDRELLKETVEKYFPKGGRS